MFCKFCGEKLEEATLFCPKCGKEQFPNENKPTIERTAELSANNDTREPQKKASEKHIKAINISLLVGYIIGTVGAILFLGIVLVGAIAYDEVYLFDGYDSTKALSIISIIFMLIGMCSVVAKLILSFGLKICKFHKNIVIKILVISLATICLSFSVWGFVDCGMANNKSSSTNAESSDFSWNFYTIYAECNCSSPWAQAGYDYLSIDTNPYDYDSDSYSATTYASSALAAIQLINLKLGLPSYLYQDMIKTRAIDGRLTYSSSRVNVSWRYHPDSGLEVRYTYK